VTFLIYRFGPNKKGLKSRPLVAGTFLCVFLWLLLSYVFQFYLSHFNQFNRTYGSLSAVIVLLFWLYFSAAAILTGGALNSALIQKD
jgi:membrane protein